MDYRTRASERRGKTHKRKLISNGTKVRKKRKGVLDEKNLQ